MRVTPTTIAGVLVIEPKVFSDERGFFFESYNEREFTQATGVAAKFVQDNHSRSVRNTVRGLHYQIRQPQGKLVRVVAGEYAGTRGPVGEIAAQPLYMDVILEPGAEFSVAVPDEHTAVAYLFEGEALVGLDRHAQGEFVRSVAMAVFEDGDLVHIQAGPELPARFMLMAGAPFHEPIVPYGPFVMNTQEEIQQVFLDLRNGTFAQG